MKITMQLLITCIIILTIALPVTFADTVTLKSGKKIEGKIIEKNEKFICIEFHGIQLHYTMDEVAQVLEEESVKQDNPPENMDKIKKISTEEIEKEVSSHFKNEDYKSAIEYLNRVIKESPNSWNAYLFLGICYYRIKNYQEAIENLNKVASLNKSSIFLYVYFGLVYKALGQNAQADQSFMKALELRKNANNLVMLPIIDFIMDYLQENSSSR